MKIKSFRTQQTGAEQRCIANVVWEDNPFPTEKLYFAVESADQERLEIEPNPFLAGLFPLALLHGERRIKVEGPVSAMLCEGLYTIHAWWRAWGLTQTGAPVIEAPRGKGAVEGRTTAIGFFSGGVDSLQMMIDNRRRFGRGDTGYIRRGIFLHGFDIGKKRKRGPETAYFNLALEHLRPLADVLDLELVIASTNLRHFPTVEGFWNKQLHGACLAAMAQAVSHGPTLAGVAATFDIANMSTWGSHPVIDPSYSTERVRMVHECARYSRLDKVRQVVSLPPALDHLRVCQVRPEDKLNCGRCEKCLRTRLALFVTGIQDAAAFGRTLPEPDLVEAHVEVHDRYTASCYRDLIAPLREAGQPKLAECLARKVTAFTLAAGEGSVRVAA